MSRITRRYLPPKDRLPDSLSPILRKIYAARGVIEDHHLHITLSDLLRPELLRGMDCAVSLLSEALQKNLRVLIVADFDADGATACAVAVRALKAMGAKHVEYLIPNRILHGYGLTPAIVEIAAKKSPDLLITVDNGISSIAEVAMAQSLGMKVLITDHHVPGQIEPPADAIVNPNGLGDSFQSKSLAGVGVIFYVMLALRAHLRGQNWFGVNRPEPNLGMLLDLVALGTVADVVPLDQNNRILVQHGLKQMRSGKSCPGIAALARVSRCSTNDIDSADLGFRIGPRLNAAGRIDDMSIGVQCLLSDNPEEALFLAEKLDHLNDQRKAIEIEMKDQAIEILDKIQIGSDLPWGIVLSEEDWHPGVIGILASRLKDRFHRPVVAFAPGREQGEQDLRGSVRSVSGFHARDALAAIATKYPSMILRFGGHAAAAGLTIEKNNLDLFSKEFDIEARRKLTAEDLQEEILSDGPLEPEDFALSLVEQIKGAGPFGHGFPEPLFDNVFQCVEKRVLREHHLKLILSTNGSNRIKAIAFGQAKETWVVPGSMLRAAYRLSCNEYNGKKTLQVRIEFLENVDSK
ncbi:Single-stranded-DNA-specific exonuclease RecJ [Gammaproteobacteria bacterium]